MDTNDFILIVFIAIVLGGAWFAVKFVRERKNNEMDSDVGPTQLKHPVLANPTLIAYVLFPVAVFLLAFVFYLLLK